MFDLIDRKLRHQFVEVWLRCHYLLLRGAVDSCLNVIDLALLRRRPILLCLFLLRFLMRLHSCLGHHDFTNCQDARPEVLRQVSGRSSREVFIQTCGGWLLTARVLAYLPLNGLELVSGQHGVRCEVWPHMAIGGCASA